MKYLLDTNIVIAASLGQGEALRDRLAKCEADDLVTSVIAFAEAVYGSMRGKPPPLDRLQRFVEEVPVLDFDYKAALAYAMIPFRRGGYDRLIAAHALSLDLTLVTNNEGDFADIRGLRVENWAASGG